MAPRSTSSSPDGEPPCEKVAIVLIDDDPAFRMGLAGLLRDDGHTLLDFARPAQIPAFNELGEVGLLVTDYEMPDQNGFELADAFHRAHPETPVIVITGLHSTILEMEAARRDFVQLLFKPVDYDDLHALIHRLAR